MWFQNLCLDPKTLDVHCRFDNSQQKRRNTSLSGSGENLPLLIGCLPNLKRRASLKASYVERNSVSQWARWTANLRHPSQQTRSLPSGGCWKAYPWAEKLLFWRVLCDQVDSYWKVLCLTGLDLRNKHFDSYTAIIISGQHSKVSKLKSFWRVLCDQVDSYWKVICFGMDVPVDMYCTLHGCIQLHIQWYRSYGVHRSSRLFIPKYM